MPSRDIRDSLNPAEPSTEEQPSKPPTSFKDLALKAVQIAPDIETERVFGAGSADDAAELRQMSRLKYGRPRAEIEAEIMAGRNV